MIITPKLQSCINNLKHLPGVYLMHDKEDQIIYIGKAKDLYKRVSQYFLKDQEGKVLRMRESVDYFETIITANEKEALVLEMNLIQKYYPKYNIILKDDKHYPYIALKKNEAYLVIKRNKNDKHYDYFGPFPSSTSAYDMIDLVNRVYKTRKCRNIPSQPCLYYHLGQCLAPCINKIDQSDLQAINEEIKSFLRGNNLEVKREYEEKLKKAMDNLDYENAQEYKKVIDAINHINTEQNVEFTDKRDVDIYAYSSKEKYLSLAMLNYRKGRLLGKQTFIVEEFDDNESQVTDLILQHYSTHETPKEIVINSEAVINNLKDFLDCDVNEAKQGKIHDLVVIAKENANNALDQYFLSARIEDDKLALLEELATLLNIKTPLHIELFDNSHIQGSAPVGAMVAFINGEKAPKLYRKFHIEHDEARDDLKSMEEIIYRHYSRLKKENKKLPDLILADGGENQINAILRSLNKVEVEIPVFGLYKNEKHQTEGIVDRDGNIYPIENKALFFLLTRMQDEVHRFAISFHQSLRLKNQTKSIFDGIPGLGKKRREMLEKAYPDINLLKSASLDELMQILPEAVAISLYNHLH